MVLTLCFQRVVENDPCDIRYSKTYMTCSFFGWGQTNSNNNNNNPGRGGKGGGVGKYQILQRPQRRSGM